MRIEHIALYVDDLERARDFFSKYFGAVSNDLYHNSKTGFSSYFLSFEDGARLELMHRPEISESPRAAERGYAHMAFSTGSRESVISLTERLRADGLRIVSEPRVTGDGYFESCVEDPEGDLIEITV